MKVSTRCISPLRILVLALPSALVFWAWNLKHPLLYTLRTIETPLLAVMACLGLAVAWGQRQKAQKLVVLLSGLGFACALALTLGQEGYFQWQRHRVLQGSPALQMIGAHIIVGFRDFASLAPLAERNLIGGIYLTRRNIAGHSLEEVRAEIDRLQALRSANGHPPLFVAADQEGGDVNHLAPLVSAHPPLGQLARLSPTARAKAAYAYGALQGIELAALGVNLNLSPVVDLKPQRGRWWLDTHTLIARRAISGDAEVVRDIAAAYSNGMQAQGVQSTLKHFPGLGPVRADTHLTPARLNQPLTELRAQFTPFEQVAKATGSAIMVAHVQLDAVDAKRPASQSRAVIDGLLRRQWGYQGLVLTDDLNMGAVYGRGIGRSTAASLDAGADLVLITYDPDQYFRALYDAQQSYRQGAIDDRRLLASRERIRRHWQQRKEEEGALLTLLGR